MPPKLPPEVWGLILWFAIYEPESLSPRLGMVDYQHFRRDLGQRRVGRALETKWYIRRVCKAWKALIEPLLNSHVIVKSFASLNAVTLAMQDVLPDGRLRGECVRRLDITADGKHIKEDSEVLRILTQIRTLLPHLPHLKTLVYRNTFIVKSRFLEEKDFFLNPVSKTVENIVCVEDDVNRDWLRVPATLFADFLNDHPNLKTYHPPRLYMSPGQFNHAKLLVSQHMPHLTGVLLPISFVPCPDLFFCPSEEEPSLDLYPNLRHATFKFTYLGPMNMVMLQGVVPTPMLIKVHGHKLTSIHCIYHKALVGDSPQLQYFDMFSRNCPNLEELGLAFNWSVPDPVYHWDLVGVAEWTGRNFPAFPKLLRMRIQRLNRHFDAGAYKTMLAFVEKLGVERKALFPNWQTLVFPCDRDVVYLQKYSSMLSMGLKGLQRLKCLGMEVVDGDGKELGCVRARN